MSALKLSFTISGAPSQEPQMNEFVRGPLWKSAVKEFLEIVESMAEINWTSDMIRKEMQAVIDKRLLRLD